MDYPAKVPAGVYALQARKNIRTINGNVIALNGATGDQFQVIVRDDLTALTEFSVQVHGYIVED